MSSIGIHVIALPAQDAEWFEAKQSKRKGGGQSNGMPSRQAPSEVTKEDEFEVRY